MYPPIAEQFSLKSSIYQLKNIDYVIPPGLTPFVTQKIKSRALSGYCMSNEPIIRKYNGSRQIVNNLITAAYVVDCI